MARLPDSYLEERRQQILDAATRVFVKKGYAAATINDIAAEAEVSAGSIYRYFENKADLIAAAANACMEADVEAWSSPLPEGITPGQAFYALGEQVRSDFNSDTHHAEAMLRLESYLAAARDPELRARLVPMLDESVERLAAFIRAAQESGEFDTGFDPVTFSGFLHAVATGIGSLSVVYGDRLDTDAVWNALIRLAIPHFTEGLQAAVLENALHGPPSARASDGMTDRTMNQMEEADRG